MNAQRNTREEKGQILLKGGRVGVLLMHGLAGSPVELRFVAQGLNRAGYTVLCPLMTGHGGSDLMLSTTRWQDWFASAESALDRLREHCDHVIIGGLSAGSLVALHVAAKRHDDIAALIMYSPTFNPNGWAVPWAFQAFKIVRQKWLANLINLNQQAPYGIKDDRVRRFVLESLQASGRPLSEVFARRGGTIYEFLKLARSARKQLPLVSMPTFVCHAREDDQSNVSNAVLVQQRVTGPVETLILDDCYHMITLDRQRALVVDQTLSFMERLTLPENVRRVGSGEQGSGTLNLVAKPGQ